MYFEAESLDDIMYKVLGDLLKVTNQISPTKGKCSELTAVLLKITNPRARLSRTETKGTAFSCLGELLWYLAGSNNLAFIEYYIPQYKKYSDDGSTLNGAYGHRLFGMDGKIHQLEAVVKKLREKPESRQGAIQLLEAKDVISSSKDVPCTCTLQFLLREGSLQMITYMRSNDAFLGLPHDFFAFSMLQEIVARQLGVEVGSYNHCVGSLHLYEEHREKAVEYINEGVQSLMQPMPGMPLGDPGQAIERLLTAENSIRHGQEVDLNELQLEPYWKDLVRLLQIHRAKKDGDLTRIKAILDDMTSRTYEPYIIRQIERLHVEK